MSTTTRYAWCPGSTTPCAANTAGTVTVYEPQGEYSAAASPTKRYYARDHLGSVMQVVDAAGNVLGQRQYAAYGRAYGATGVVPAMGYAGMWTHAPSGLSLTPNRAYSGATGRWLSKDPMGEAGGINLYAYVGGNPLSYTDPRGLDNPGMGPYGPFPASMGFRRGVPGDSCTCMVGSSTFYAPPGTNFSKVRSVGQANGWNPIDVDRNVGHWGTFDFQRDVSMNQFTGAYTNAANFAVGVYMQGAGYSRGNTGRIAGGFAGAFSSNAGDPNQSKYWMMGWDAANSGSLEYICQ